MHLCHSSLFLSLTISLSRSLARTRVRVRASTVRARALSLSQPPPTNLLACMRESPGICNGPFIPFPWVKESPNQFSGKTSKGWIEAVAFIPRSVSVNHASTFLLEPAWMNPCTAPVNSACIPLVDGCAAEWTMTTGEGSYERAPCGG